MSDRDLTLLTLKGTGCREHADALHACLVLIEKGHSIDSCLTAHPDHAAELRPLLELALALRRRTKPRQRRAAVSAGRRRVLARARARRVSRRGQRNTPVQGGRDD